MAESNSEAVNLGESNVREKVKFGKKSRTGSKHVTAIIVGAGPGGICVGISLMQAGLDDFVVFEREAEVGGTWARNPYPGCACDLKSDMYSFSFDLNPRWSRPFAPWHEIREYFEDCARKYGVLSRTKLNSAVTAAHWDSECTTWRVVTENGDVWTADYLISSVGMFNRPKWPEIAGLDSFEGDLEHSCGYNPDTEHAGKRVAIIGTGAATIQILPAIAPEASKTLVFQRTAPWILPKEDEIYDEDYIEDLAQNPIKQRLQRLEIYAFAEDYVNFKNNTHLKEQEKLAREHLLSVVDPDLRKKLTPNYPWGFSRPLVSSAYLPCFNRDDVELVTDAIEKITPNSIQTVDGSQFEVDLIICATGYHTTEFASAIDVHGWNGVSLKDEWAEGARAYRGIMMSGFPNFFMTYGPNTNNGSIIFMIECQAKYISEKIVHMEESKIAWIDVKPEELDKYNKRLQKDISEVSVWNLDANAGGSGYYWSDSGRNVTQCPYTMNEYRALIMEPDEDAFNMQHGTSLII